MKAYAVFVTIILLAVTAYFQETIQRINVSVSATKIETAALRSRIEGAIDRMSSIETGKQQLIGYAAADADSLNALTSRLAKVETTLKTPVSSSNYSLVSGSEIDSERTLLTSGVSGQFVLKPTVYRIDSTRGMVWKLIPAQMRDSVTNKLVPAEAWSPILELVHNK